MGRKALLQLIHPYVTHPIGGKLLRFVFYGSLGRVILARRRYADQFSDFSNGATPLHTKAG